MIVLDTTVLIYAVGEDHEFRDPCRSLLTAIESRAVRATTTVEVIQEFVHVRARRRGRLDAVERARAYQTLLAPLVVATEEHLLRAMEIYAASERIGMFDAVLAALAIDGAATLLSADRGFAGVVGLDHVVPTREGVGILLAADR